MDVGELDSLLDKSAGGAAAEPGTSTGLTLKERFRRTMFFQEVEVRPNFEFGYWAETLTTWHEQGLPGHIMDEASAYEYFGIENWETVSGRSGPMPLYEYTVIEETDDYVTYRDEYGCTARINKHGNKSIPHFIDFPIKDRASWEPFKAALDPEDPRRWNGVEESVARARNSLRPVGAWGGSLAGEARNLIGFQGIAMMQHEDPELLTEIIHRFGACAVAALERILPRMQVDFCMGWEDICFNRGCILSPDFFQRVAGPWYRRIADLLLAHGCCIYTTDTDGNITPIVAVFLDNGLNTMFPCEVHAGSDPCALRARYGKRIRIWGGVDKMKLKESKEAIDAELKRLLPCVEQGGFIPGVDHRVPADVPLSHYRHYLDRKRELFRVGGEPKY
jgi:uroporphyrinogen decarboxylase